MLRFVCQNQYAGCILCSRQHLKMLTYHTPFTKSATLNNSPVSLAHPNCITENVSVCVKIGLLVQAWHPQNEV